MKNISKDQLRQLADKANLTTRKLDSGNTVVVLGADNDFGYDVIVILQADDKGWVSATGMSPDFDGAHSDGAKLIALCNAWNKEKRIPKAHYDLETKSTVTEYHVRCNEDVSEQFIVENCIKLGVGGAWGFFCSLVKN